MDTSAPLQRRNDRRASPDEIREAYRSAFVAGDVEEIERLDGLGDARPGAVDRRDEVPA